MARAELSACIQPLWGLIGNFMSPAGDFRHIISFSLTPAAHQGHPHWNQTHTEKQQQITINLHNEISPSISSARCSASCMMLVFWKWFIKNKTLNNKILTSVPKQNCNTWENVINSFWAWCKQCYLQSKKTYVQQVMMGGH